MELTSIGQILRDRIKNYETSKTVYQYGTVLRSSDGIALVEGLKSAIYGELIEFENNIYGLAMELGMDRVGVVLLNEIDKVVAGTEAKGTGRVVEAPVGQHLCGRVIDPIGRPLDRRRLEAARFRPIEAPAPAIVDRAAVDEPLETGILVVDAAIPIGKGQRELIIGDRQTGKTAIAIDAILNQKGKGVYCVYCAVGQKASTVAITVERLRKAGALEYTVVVVAGAGECAAMQYVAPFAACAIAEDFMYDGKDALIVYDDLSKHSVAYRSISLLLRRPPGREAFPGDIFYLHSRLLERAAKLRKELGGGSLSALPIVETMEGDISAYIPTNIISITDGQIYLESSLFHAGVRPAVNVGLSVSRVGGAAQTKAMKSLAGTLRLDLAQYNEFAAFAQFGSDLDYQTLSLIENGKRQIETLKQEQFRAYSLPQQVALLVAAREGFLKKVPLDGVKAFNDGLLTYLQRHAEPLMAGIASDGLLGEERRNELKRAIEEYARSRG